MSILSALLDSADLLRCVLAFLSVSELAGLFAACARRRASEFCRAITVLHCGAVCAEGAARPATNEEHFGELFTVERAFSAEVTAQLRTVVLAARESPSLPLDYACAARFVRRWCAALRESGGRLRGAETVALDVDRAASSCSLLSVVQLSQLAHLTLRDQVLHGKAPALRYLMLQSPYTGVPCGESALDSTRIQCAHIARIDFLFTLSLQDFVLFVRPDAVYASLVSLDIGRLLQSFVHRLEMEEHFGEGNGDGERERQDNLHVVCAAVARSLSLRRFPSLLSLEVFAPMEFVHAFFAALIEHWVGSSSDRETDRESDRERERQNEVFVGAQLRSLVVCATNMDFHCPDYRDRWTRLFRCDCAVRNAVDPCLQCFGLFPALREAVFAPDLPCPHAMLLTNCAATSPPVPLSLRVHAEHCATLGEFLLLTAHPSNRRLWALRSLEILSHDALHAVDMHRALFGEREHSLHSVREGEREDRQLHSMAHALSESLLCGALSSLERLCLPLSLWRLCARGLSQRCQQEESVPRQGKEMRDVLSLLRCCEIQMHSEIDITELMSSLALLLALWTAGEKLLLLRVRSEVLWKSLLELAQNDLSSYLTPHAGLVVRLCWNKRSRNLFPLDGKLDFKTT